MKPLTVLKIGGKLVESESELNEVLQQFSNINHTKILVHGGGKMATEICERLGIPPKMVNGRRITDEKTLKVVTMVYAGWTNKLIVSQLQKIKTQAMGFSGADGNMILAKKRSVKEIDFGFAGDIQKVNVEGLNKWLLDGITPVFCAITHDGNGQLLNTNADTIATSLASALSSKYHVRLNFCFEKEGVLANTADDTSVFRMIQYDNFSKLQKQGIIKGGMIPKMENAFQALVAGVNEVKICGILGINSDKGTHFYL
ncbi:acetylglutamate kinase [Saprospiraceae bacterium]|jgi:acetylglutamate kinase|nr:acetylglutamate kinase [Saprospiraceae bacterium]